MLLASLLLSAGLSTSVRLDGQIRQRPVRLGDGGGEETLEAAGELVDRRAVEPRMAVTPLRGALAVISAVIPVS